MPSLTSLAVTILALGGSALTEGSHHHASKRQLAALASLPKCASGCFINSFFSSAGGCGMTDFKCLCSAASYIGAVTSCALKCPPSDQMASLKFATTTCTNAGVKLNLPPLGPNGPPGPPGPPLGGPPFPGGRPRFGGPPGPRPGFGGPPSYYPPPPPVNGGAPGVGGGYPGGAPAFNGPSSQSPYGAPAGTPSYGPPQGGAGGGSGTYGPVAPAGGAPISTYGSPVPDSVARTGGAAPPTSYGSTAPAPASY